MLITPKVMVVLGQEIELTKDTIAASVPAEGALSPLVEVEHPCVLTREEAFTAIMAIEDHLGTWSPAFLHAFFGFEMASTLGFQLGCDFTPEGGGYPSLQAAERLTESAKKGGISRHPIKRVSLIARLLIPPLFPNSPTMSDGSDDGYPPPRLEKADGTVNRPLGPHPEGSSLPGVQPDGFTGVTTESVATEPVAAWWSDISGVPPTLIQRVWNPGPRWQLLNELARVTRARRLAEARDSAAAAFRYSGFYRPTWWGKQPGRGYAWYSNRSFTSGLSAFREIIEDQYGPMVDGKLHAPRRKPWVPF